VLVAVPYAVQRLFLQVSRYLGGPALVFAVWSLFRGEYRNAGIWAGVCVACFCYFMAFRTPRDVTAHRR
jgi:hypothetical protein